MLELSVEIKLTCIFGCRRHPDRIDHYIRCHLLWSLLDWGFGGNLPACLFSRLNYSLPTVRNLYIVAAAFEIYHALKVGHRPLVDEAVSTQRCAAVMRQANLFARDHGNSYRRTRKETRKVSVVTGSACQVCDRIRVSSLSRLHFKSDDDLISSSSQPNRD